MVVLGSREQLCIHDEVSLLRGRTQNNACRSLCRKRGNRHCNHFTRVSGYSLSIYCICIAYFVLCPPRYMIKLLEIVMVSNFRRVQRTSMRVFIMIILKNDQHGSLQSKTSFARGKIYFGLVKFKSYYLILVLPIIWNQNLDFLFEKSVAILCYMLLFEKRKKKKEKESCTSESLKF